MPGRYCCASRFWASVHESESKTWKEWSSAPIKPRSFSRSEEHTAELQTPCNLVCRLLLGTTDSNREARSASDAVIDPTTCQSGTGLYDHSTSDTRSTGTTVPWRATSGQGCAADASGGLVA